MRTLKIGNKIGITGSKGTDIDLILRYITVKSDGITHLVPNSILLNNKVSIVDPETDTH